MRGDQCGEREGWWDVSAPRKSAQLERERDENHRAWRDSVSQADDLRVQRDEARKAGTRPRVFCASMADVFDNQASEDWRIELWRLIRATPHLDWLLLTKRPQAIGRMLPSDLDHGRGNGWSHGPWPNVWLGTTVENQAEANRRIPHLLMVPAAHPAMPCHADTWLRIANVPMTCEAADA